MADAFALAVFDACSRKYAGTRVASEDAGRVALQYGELGVRGIPPDVAIRGANSANHAERVSDTLACVSNTLGRNGRLGSAEVGLANLDYDSTVRDVRSAQNVLRQLTQ